MRHRVLRPEAALLLAGAALLPFAAAYAAESAPPATPASLVSTYDRLADTILGSKRTEEELVKAILETTYGHAQAEVGKARGALKAGDAKGAGAALERAAAYVGQIGTEGDAAIAAVRKRLLEGGHHHNADGEAKGVYDEGYVVVTRASKAIFLAASKALAQSAASPSEDAITREWGKVKDAWADLMKAK